MKQWKLLERSQHPDVDRAVRPGSWRGDTAAPETPALPARVRSKASEGR